MTFRQRIIVSMIPLFVLLVALGVTGAALIYHLGGQVDRILHENYDSIVYMRNLNEALERIDSSFQFALAGREIEYLPQYKNNWPIYDSNLDAENHNITIPGEGDLAASLTDLTKKYRHKGDEFYKSHAAGRAPLYFGTDGLLAIFGRIKKDSGDILRLNEDNMKNANTTAQRIARSSLIWYACGLVFGIGLAVLLIASTIRTIVYPIRAVTQSAMAIGAGNLDQVVPITSEDELGRLAAAFNTMARQLRDYRKSHKAQLIRAQQTSQATIDSFPDPVLVVDPEQHVEMANPVARRLFGVLPRDADNKAPSPIWEPPERLREPLAAALREQREFLPEGFDKAIMLQVGEEPRSFLPRILPIRDSSGGTLGAAILLEDITRFRLLDEIKTNLVATVSHELKTPLTSIRLVLHLLLEEGVGPLAPKQVELVVDARDNAERLLGMINNLLDLARLEQGGSLLQLVPEQPSAIVRTVADNFRPRAEDCGVEFVVEEVLDLKKVAVDPDRFQHALQNLLDNALAHTPQGGRILLSTAPAEDSVVFSVEDNGTGIPPEYQPLIFEKYFRVPGDNHPHGTGLGLAIVREIVTAHGGSINCQSQPGKKTVFRISVPLWLDRR